MKTTLRKYHATDYERIAEFLIRHHQPNNADGNWLEPTWEYMHGHPQLDHATLEHIGIWEAGGEIVAVVHPESSFGEAFFEFHPDYRHLRAEMLDYAEAHLAGTSKKDGRRFLQAYANDFDAPLCEFLQSRGYREYPEEARPLAQMIVPDPFPAVSLPEGFCLTSLAQECDWGKLDRVLWRGFNHPGEPQESEERREKRRVMFDTPTARRELKVAVRAPNGEFAAFCGMFYQAQNRFAYVEPVATDPAYRRLGLGRAAVLEGIRRCLGLGAQVAYVGSDQPFYLSFGFQVIYTTRCYARYLE